MVSTDELIAQWAGEAVALAASHGVEDAASIMGLFRDPHMDQMAAALRIGRGEVPKVPLTEGDRSGIRGFVERPDQRPEGSVSWLALLASKNQGEG